jgi:hypothetical protein
MAVMLDLHHEAVSGYDKRKRAVGIGLRLGVDPKARSEWRKPRIRNRANLGGFDRGAGCVDDPTSKCRRFGGAGA